MADLLKALFGTTQYESRTDTTPGGPDPDPNDLWAFTDPDARDEYARRGQVKRLEQDIRFEVMRGRPWQPEGVIADKGTYWFRSPHPTVYRARQDDQLIIADREYRFLAGDDLVFQCRMERDEAEEDPGPALVARLQPGEKAVLCGEMSGAMKGVGR